MKKHGNTIYVTTQGSYLHKEGECVCVRVDSVEKGKIPIHGLEGVVCFGQIGVSPFLLGHLAENGVSLTFLTEHGKFLARLVGPVSGNVLLRREQYRRADDLQESARLATGFLLGKIANSRTVLQRACRDHGEGERDAILRCAALRLKDCLQRVNQNESALDALRGVEGEAAAAYFDAFSQMITVGGEAFTFHQRSRRPPLDRINCLLSFLYSLLAHDARSALETVGLDPAVGYLHRDRPGRPSLALDLMEELRPVLADRVALTLINRQEIAADDFKILESGAVILNDDARKKLLISWQQKKTQEILHPYLQETVTLGSLCRVQALLLARYLRGDLDAYPPFIYK
ncbi:type I-C CRISPR-associated endonuclease Cas1 [bacterium]|nr:MAG: type I-C CRISPR-associated endonuclease Cas1 [bacterium]